MPSIFRIGPYFVYFWLNEGTPLEPIHVHVSEGKPSENATKIWILEDGTCSIEHNNSKIPNNKLNDIVEIIENNSVDIVKEWESRFGKISYKKIR